ncbi:glycosyltransferase [Sphingomonas sp. 2R-10]|uniref:glycosyltransferase family 2 protein n=1 Tax=Sphingomonas sp. 2R-10 TaxID=3045148 RepID=UPI0024BBC61F|nr:glycosyltransferase [Sphingomonas sp. 2R-10]MDJ0276767.1 glycosyltransferase [Sphingomonas sp. 2R-10]
MSLPPVQHSAPPPTLSVIVPVYNMAAYLEGCIRSILDQSLPDLEVVAVDDGSSDDSLDILRAIARQDARLRVFAKPNGGQGSARNLGLAQAQGRYIAFVDSDDTIAPDLLARVLPFFSDPMLDIVSFGLEFRDDQGQLVAARGPDREFASTGDAIFIDAMMDRNFLTSVCNKVYRRALLSDNDITFPELRAFEDSVFSRDVARHTRSVRYIPDRLYVALTRRGSTSRGLSTTSFEHAATMIELERRMFCECETDPVRIAAFHAHVARFFAYLILLAAFRINDRAERMECRRIADQAGFTVCATDPRAMALLPARVRMQIWLARLPKVQRLLAVTARHFNRGPY